jgi:molybdate transport system regulatory protein
MRILEAIKRCGSINAAAKDLKMSYRAVWGKIQATEESLGEPLLERNVGGASGGGSRLTPFAEKIMQRFYRMRHSIEEEADRIFKRTFADKNQKK